MLFLYCLADLDKVFQHRLNTKMIGFGPRLKFFKTVDREIGQHAPYDITA
jgi:hypothetical protein